MNKITEKALNKLCKWRTVFCGWQLGTRPSNDPEAQAVRDSVDRMLVLRAEVSALAMLLMKKGVFSVEEFEAQIGVEASMLDSELEKFFPGFKTTSTGLSIDAKIAKETTRGWRP